MKRIILRISVVLVLVLSISAQENEPQLFDEFGNMPLDELMARIDSLANAVNQTPRSKALVRISGGNGNYAYIRGSVIKGVWKIARKNPPEKLSIQFCDVYKEPIFIRFYVVRENDKVETCTENLTVPKETVLLETSSSDSLDWKFESIEVAGAFVDSWGGEYSEYSQDALKRLLGDSPDSKVYIIAYTLTNFKKNENGDVISRRTKVLDKKYIAQKMLRLARANLLKRGVSPSQIISIDGGYINDLQRKLEFWFVPKGGAVPKPQPDYVPKRRRKR